MAGIPTEISDNSEKSPFSPKLDREEAPEDRDDRVESSESDDHKISGLDFSDTKKGFRLSRKGEKGGGKVDFDLKKVVLQKSTAFLLKAFLKRSLKTISL